MTIENALEEILFKYKLSFAKSEKRFVILKMQESLKAV
jgi:hypothetical protein